MNRFFTILAYVCLLSGCSREPKTYDVSGTVNWEDGTPLEAGLIFFDPAPGTDGPQGSATIRNGAFATSPDGRKVGPGAYNVRIEGYSGKGGRESPLGKLAFNDFEQTVTLPASNSTQNFEVPKKGAK